MTNSAAMAQNKNKKAMGSFLRSTHGFVVYLSEVNSSKAMGRPMENNNSPKSH